MNREPIRRLPGKRVISVAEASHLRLAIALIAAAFLSTATGWAGETQAPQARAKATAPAQRVGVFTGQSVDGAPVYRLAPLTVVAERNDGLTRMKRQIPVAHARQAPAKLAGRPPA